MQDVEKLGLFYLGREYDLSSGTRLETPVLYDSRDLVTHAVCVGMTGSGKTGLCLSLIEEAAIDGVPVIAIDPKGDLGNLLLTFPGLAAADFAPWIDADEARRAGATPAAYAAGRADAWRQGLADWGQDAARIERLRASADFAIYTPGSRAGLPVSVLSSFAAPDASLRDDAEMLAERAGGTATSLLTLAGATAEPRSREHTLTASLLSAAWKEGRDLDLAALIQQIQAPPFSRMGVLDLESFFPEKDRFELAMRFNAVLAAPGFDQWFEGTPLDPGTLLYGAGGRPRVSILSIAHLGDAERMFFVSLLLNQMVGWMRAQSGTSSLRAILYMDEIAGYFPPVANPPSKPPLLTLLKQARAFGLGVVLSTQNPVDLDYKGLANTGTWFLGRLQTQRDKDRVLDGLEGAAAGGLDRAEADRILSALGTRTFLLHDVHEKRPVVFQTRWTLSYLRGPLSRDQIRALMAERGGQRAEAPEEVLPAKAGSYGKAGSYRESRKLRRGRKLRSGAGRASGDPAGLRPGGGRCARVYTGRDRRGACGVRRCETWRRYVPRRRVCRAGRRRRRSGGLGARNAARGGPGRARAAAGRRREVPPRAAARAPAEEFRRLAEGACPVSRAGREDRAVPSCGDTTDVHSRRIRTRVPHPPAGRRALGARRSARCGAAEIRAPPVSARREAPARAGRGRT